MLPPLLERAANSAYHFSFFWLYNCIYLSFPLMMRNSFDLIISVPEFTNLFS